MNLNKISKRLSWLLRHCQEPLYIDLQGGWAPVEAILEALSTKKRVVDRRMLETIVADDEKGRYSFDASGERIRANQGHSIPGVVIEMEKPVPPEYLYHGTAVDSLPSIMEKGLLPMGRQYVHISPDYETAVRVGARHGRNHGGTAVLEFAAGDFVRDGHDLWIASNGVWQAKIVPPQYLQVRVRYCEKQIPADSRQAAPDAVTSDPASAEGSGSEIKTDRYAIPCKYSMPVLGDRPLKGIILGIHGFSGSKESTGLHVLAKKAVPEGYGLVCFDLPAHWKSPAAPQMLTVENAMRDILFMAGECRREFPDLPKYIFATSFGAYLTLLCCKESRRFSVTAGGEKGLPGANGENNLPAANGEKGQPDAKVENNLPGANEENDQPAAGGELADYRIILRAPAVTMPHVFLSLLNMTAEEFCAKAPLDCTNDPARPLPVYYSFYESLMRHSVFDADKEAYPPMLVMHGDADEVVPPGDVRRFCGQFPQMDLHVIPGCDHGFTAPGAHEEMCRLTMDYLQTVLQEPAVITVNGLNMHYITAAAADRDIAAADRDITAADKYDGLFLSDSRSNNSGSGGKTRGKDRTRDSTIGRGRPVVLVHGNGEDHHLFDTEIRQLAQAGFTVYAPDSRGHGETTFVSDEPVTEYHYADMAEDIYQFIKALGLRKPALYGHSDGGIIALLMEISHPGTLGILAVSGTNLSPRGLLPSFIEEYTEINKKEEDPLVTLMLTEPDIDPESLKKITIPVLVTAGDNDLILRSETEKIAETLPDSEMVIVENADHGSYIVDSEIMGKMLLDFLRKRWQ